MNAQAAEDRAQALWAEVVADAHGLIPCVTQDLRTRAVLMVAWVSQSALARALETGFAVYWSRSRNTLWEKGAVSGNRQRLIHVRLDNDRDTLLYLVDAQLPAGNDGSDTYFNYRRQGSGWIWDPIQIRDDLGEGGGLDEVFDVGSEALSRRLRDHVEQFLRERSGGDDLERAADVLETLTRTLKTRGMSLKEVLVHLEARVRKDSPGT